jgi:hypothetical protein
MSSTDAAAISIMSYLTALTMVFGLAVYEGSNLAHRLDSSNAEIRALRARLTLLEVQQASCATDQATWHKWLALRAEGHGSAWFLLPRTREAAE